MENELHLLVSELESAKSRNDRNYLAREFSRAREVLERGGKVKISQSFSDAHQEILHVIDDLENLKSVEKQYLD